MTEIIDVSPLARRFAEEYLVDFKVATAAERAGCSPGAAYQYLQDPRIDALIREGKRRSSERAQISVDNVLHDFATFKAISPADFFDEVDEFEIPRDKTGKVIGVPFPTGRRLLVLKPLDEWSDDMRHALKSIKHTANGVAIEIHDKLAANVHIGKFLGMFVDKHELSGPGGKPLELITKAMDPKQAAEAYAATLQG